LLSAKMGLALAPQEQVITVSLDREELINHRKRFPAWMDADQFDLLPSP
jgi:omega-amidase